MDINIVKKRFLSNGNLDFITIAGGANSDVRRFEQNNQLYFKKTMSKCNIKYINRENLILHNISNIPNYQTSIKAVQFIQLLAGNAQNAGQVTTKSAGLDLLTWNYAPTWINGQKCTNIYFNPLLFLKFLRGTINALYTIHKIGIVHCDLKVDQICIPYKEIARGDESIKVDVDFDDIRIIDFGVSLWEGKVPLGRETIGISTNKYLSASFLENVKKYDATLNADYLKNINYSVDLYSLGYLIKNIISTIYTTVNKPYSDTWNNLTFRLNGLANSLLNYENGLQVPYNTTDCFPHEAYIQNIDKWIQEVSKEIQNDKKNRVVLFENNIPDDKRMKIPWNIIIGAIVFLSLVFIFREDIKKLITAEVNNTDEQQYALSLHAKAQKLFNENKRIEAIELFKQSSELGNLDARYSLASEYLIGKFIKEDEEAGIRLLKEAALSGHQPSIDLLKKLNISY